MGGGCWIREAENIVPRPPYWGQQPSGMPGAGKRARAATVHLVNGHLAYGRLRPRHAVYPLAHEYESERAKARDAGLG